MTADEIRRAVLQALTEIAPEAASAPIDPGEDLREALDLDSMDILRFATALHERLGVDVPESDYAGIATLDGCVRYLEQALQTSDVGRDGRHPGGRR